MRDNDSWRLISSDLAVLILCALLAVAALVYT